MSVITDVCDAQAAFLNSFIQSELKAMTRKRIGNGDTIEKHPASNHENNEVIRSTMTLIFGV